MKITAIVKPTHECNLSCKYCYVEDSAEQGRMNSKTLENTIQGLMQLPDRDSVHFIWHGGEPVMMGIEFYKEVVGLQNCYNGSKKIENSMQTNATLLDDEVLDFCEKYQFDIGSSIDGPEEIHNLTRIYSDGRGSFNDVWRGLEMIRERNKKIKKRDRLEKGKPKHLGGGVITILTKNNIDRIDEVYDFFKLNNISIKINPLIKSGRAKEKYKDLSIGSSDYGRALVKVFDKWFYEGEEGIDIDPLSDILGNLMTNKTTSCNFGKSCRSSFVSVGPQGDVYPCGRFDGVKRYNLGNVNEKGLSQILESKKHEIMKKRGKKTLNGCSKCEYGEICNAGCMHNAYMKRGRIDDKDFYCASYKILFKHLNKALDVEFSKAELKGVQIKMKKIRVGDKKLNLNNISNPKLRRVVKQRSRDFLFSYGDYGDKNGWADIDHNDYYHDFLHGEWAQHADNYSDGDYDDGRGYSEHRKTKK